MQAMKLTEIAKALNINEEFSSDIIASGVSTDTRTLKQGDLFIAIKGNNYNGHDFISVAESKGACGVICSEEIKSSLPILRVKNTILALQALALYYRTKLKTKIIAVTGSNGKTTTKNMIATVLNTKYKVFSTDRNYNNEIGLPLSILDIDNTYDIAVLEMGMNHLGEIEVLSNISKPDIAIITNIGKAHIGNLKSQENILKAKLEITSGLNPKGLLILNSDDIYLKNIKSTDFKNIFIGLDSKTNNDIYATDIKSNNLLTEFKVVYSDKQFDFELPTIGIHNVYNSLFAVYCGIYFKIDMCEIAHSLKTYSISPMRCEIACLNGINIIKDYYNSSPESAKIAIENLSDFKSNGKKIAILGQMCELGEFSKKEHFDLAVYCCQMQLDEVFFIGEDFQSFKEGMKKHSNCFNTNEINDMFRCIKHYVEEGNLSLGDTILIKGSRNMKMENVYEFLKTIIRNNENIHPVSSSTKLYVDVNAVKFNYQQIKNAVGHDVEIMPMVKANAYGAGVDIIANMFQSCKYLAVADVKEAQIIHDMLPQVELVIIYQPLHKEISEIVQHNYIPAVSDIEFARKLNDESLHSNKITKIHVEIDTGHGRLGINTNDVVYFAKELLKLKNLKVEGLFMHYVCADSTDQSDLDFTEIQTNLFNKAVHEFEKVYGFVRYKHACAGAAIFNKNANHFNMVRPGYILYGYYPSEDIKRKITLKPSLKFTSYIVQIREVPENTPISYNRRFITKRKSKIATIGIGYSDGIFRSLYNKTHSGCFVVNGQRAPIVGSICMDLTMIDITDIKGEINVGDEVSIFDNTNVTVDEMADICGTIGYEIISRVAEKTERVEIF